MIDASVERAAGFEAQSLRQAVRKRSAETPDKVAIKLKGHSMTYGELDRASRQLANGLISLGVGASDRVGVLDKNSVNLFEIWVGLSTLSAVIVPINARLAASEIECAVSEANLRVLFIGESFVDLLRNIQGRLMDIKKIIVLDETYLAWRRSFASD
jgi:acyl-CoA synthetase (AMP-forming)/AMP-acid ligase II